MAAHVFRFYSLEPEVVFRMAYKRWPSDVVRRHAWKVGGSVIWYLTLVLDDRRGADEFEQWLGQNARRENIRGLVGRAGHGAGRAYVDVVFHRGKLKSRVRMLFSVIRFWLSRVRLGIRELPSRL